MALRSLRFSAVRHTLLTKGLFLTSLFAFSIPLLAQLSPSEKADIGFTSLQLSLGLAMPTGEGVSVSQIEAPEGSGSYRPNTALFTDKTFTFPSGGNTGISSHANTVGAYMYGSSSLAPNLGSTATSDFVTVYEANNWIGSGFLKTGNSSILPATETNDIQNHSWVSSGSSSFDTEILQRMDYAIAQDDFVAVFGLNNGSGTTLPSLMGQSYNGITVGLSNGNHSRGTTTVDGSGRTKPDIVVPTSATSWATATVSGAAALVIETARSTPGLSNAQTSETVKAILLAGASKDEPEFAGGWSHTSTQPLDDVYGAGELNIQVSYDIETSGEFNASTNSFADDTGWDFGTAAASPNDYFFDLTANTTEVSFTAVLTWNATVIATDNQQGPSFDYSFTTIVPNLDLYLYNATTGFIVGSIVTSSVSTVDNVELIYVTGLAPGQYALGVSSNTVGTEYGLAWVTTVPEPGVASLLLLGCLGLSARVFRNRRRD